jgi:AraC family transcriptional regulator
MEPEIVEKPGFKVAGLETPFVHILSEDGVGEERVGKLWGAFGAAVPRIANRARDEVAFGIVYPRPEGERSHPDELQYICSNEVTTFDGMPEEFATYEVPANRYAIFTHRGPITTLEPTIRHAYREWLPNSEFEHAGPCDVERYDERFCHDGDESEMEYWIPVREKARG